MAFKIALAVGLFIVICGSPALKSSQVVPDGLVYTEVKKTLVLGVQGLLTCRFYGKPIAVFWENGLDPDDLSLMVIWHDGEVSGPRFDDGSCNVDENYSLIINNVSPVDSGRIYCRVSNYKGILIKNYTDISITDTALATNPQVILQIRQATYGILQCTVHIKARRISWKRGTTSSANESLVDLNNNETVVKKSGTGYDEGAYNITEHYSLVIKEVQVHHEGLYICEVTDFDTGISFRNHSFVNVVAPPLTPFPTIQECLNTDQHDSNYCTLVAKSGMTLTCEAMKYYPTLHLLFLHGSRIVDPLDTSEWNNTDGTINKTLTIDASGSKELYKCVAFNIPGISENRSTSVLLHYEDKFQSAVLVMIIILFAALTLISLVVYFIWRKKHLNYSPVPRSAPQQELEDFAVKVKELTLTELEALQKGVSRVLIKHCRMICDAIERESFQAEKIINENRSALFNTNRMLIDWQSRLTSTSCQYKRAYEHTYIVAHNSGPVIDQAWPSNEELRSISHHLKQECMNEICTELQVDYKPNDANDDEKRFDSLCEWRSKASDKSLKEKFMQLCSVLESNNLRGLLPSLKGPYIYTSELVDLAFHLLMHDLFPIAKALGISVTKLASYRPAFHPSHLVIGTIKLLIELLASMKGEDMSKRSIFYSKITKLHYQDVARRGVFEYDMSYGELYSTWEAIHQRAGRRTDLTTSGMLPGPGIPDPLRILQDVLQLTDQDIADRLDNSRPLTAYALFKIWKEKPRQSVFNYRAVLALEIRRTGMPDLADEIIAGTYITERTSLAFIENMVQGLNRDEKGSLGELLQLSRDNEVWHTTTPSKEIPKQIYDWVAHWTKGIKGSSLSNAVALLPYIKTTTEKHRDLNDKLVEHGFLDLAREVMIIEQQLATL